MRRRFSSNTSVNLILLDDPMELDQSHKKKSNSLVEMFDPIFDKHVSNGSDHVDSCLERSSSSEDIFAPPEKWKTFDDTQRSSAASDDLFQEINAMESRKYESIYPSLTSFRRSISIDRYSVFEVSDERSELSYELRESIFSERSISAMSADLFNDGFANRDLERLMKEVTELQMQSINLATDDKTHLVFDPVTPSITRGNDLQQDSIRIVVDVSSCLLAPVEPFIADIDVFSTSERKLIELAIGILKREIDISNLYLRISGRGEYLRQGEFPLIHNRSVFQCYRTQAHLKLVMETINFTDRKFSLKDNLSADISNSVYQLLDSHFTNISRTCIETGFITLNSYRNSIVSMLREYRSNNLDLPSIEASLNVLKDKCKSLCVICYNIYTADVAQQIIDLEYLTGLMNIAYSARIDQALAQSVENLIKGLDNIIKVIIQMINEITKFCNCNFSVRTEKLCLAGLSTSLSGMQTILKCRKQFSVKLGSICSFDKISSHKSFFIKLSIKVGSLKLSDFLNHKYNSITDHKVSNDHEPLKIHPKFSEFIPFNETIVFENLNMSCFPLEACMFIQIFGHRISSDNQTSGEELLGWSEVSLFDSVGMLRQGDILVGIWPNTKKSKYCHGSNHLKSCAVLKVVLPDFHIPVKYSCDKLPTLDEIAYLKPTNSELKSIEEMVNSLWLNSSQEVARKSCNMLWKHRGYLMNTPRLYIALFLSLVSASPDDIECDSKDFIVNYMDRCHKNLRDDTYIEMLQLLGPFMPLVKIRKWAVETLKEMGPDRCISIIPWMVEALKYDINLNSSGMECLLLHFSLININFSTNLFWQLSSVQSEDIHGYKAMLLLGLLRSLVNNAIVEMWNMQLIVVENLQTAATAVKNSKNPSERKGVLHTKLEELYDFIRNKTGYEKMDEEVEHPLCEFRIPYHPGLVLTKLEMKDCSYFNSFTLPLRIIFKGLDSNLMEVMFKSGDDLRQDILVLGLFKLMDDIWTSEGLDLRMVHYRVMSTGHRCGLVELVGDCTTLRKVQETKGIAAPLTSVNGISEWLKCQNTTKAGYLQSVNNFLLTCAACCVSTYLLGIGDRHNDNIMIQTMGCVFHIDFAKILGDAQTFAGIKRDRVPFVLTQDMVHVLEDYQPVSNDRRTGMQLLIDKCCEAYNIIRRHWSSLQAILMMAAEANIPGVNGKTIQYVVKMLRLECSDIQAAEQFTDLIRKSVNSISTPMNFVIHNLAQMKYSNNDEGSLFSFTPKIYKNGPRIVNISIKSVKKIRSPNKYYTYELWISRESTKKVEIVYRRYEHFLELGQQLATTFSINILRRQYQTILQCGPPGSVVAAESRKAVLEQFVSSIMILEDEISQCDLMQTFFHSTLSDEQLMEENSFNTIPDAIEKDYSEIQIQFNISNKSKLEVFVKHARNLVATRLNEPPNPYVKTYLLPGYIGKRKTAVIMKNSSPSFNDIITYNNLHIKADTKIEISVWHKEVLGENFCLGSIILPISDKISTAEKWYRLKSRQNSESLNANRNLTIERLSNSSSITSSSSNNFSNPRDGKLV